jgi:hypothetical protein
MNWRDDMRVVLPIFAGLVILLTIIGGLLRWDSYESPEKTEMLYRSWMKGNPGTELSQAEWQALRQAELLPGQTVDGKARTAAAVATGLAIGSAAGRR